MIAARRPIPPPHDPWRVAELAREVGRLKHRIGVLSGWVGFLGVLYAVTFLGLLLAVLMVRS